MATEMTKLPAGNSHRHQQPEDSTLWDRLRADLNNLGAAYGELPVTATDLKSYVYDPVTGLLTEMQPAVTPQAPLTPWGEMLAAMRNGLLGAATSQRRDSGAVDNLSPTDRNAYFDGIILAARKKREREYGSLIYDPMSDNGHEWSWNTEACAHCGLTSTDIVQHGDVKCDGGKARNGRLTLSAAMSRPLDWEPRVGHKGVEIDG